MGLIEDRMKDKKILLFQEIKELCIHEARVEKCDGFIQGIKINSDLNASASFVTRGYSIDFNMDMLMKDATSFADFLIKSKKFDENNRNLYINLLILVTSFHELEHALQRLHYLTGKIDGLKAYLYYICRKIINLDNQNLYLNNYFYLPTERDAELTAWLKTLKILSKLEIESRELVELQKYFIALLVSKYDKKINLTYIGPFEQLLKKYSLKEYSNKKDEIRSSMSTYSSYERARLGLPIYTSEMQEYISLYNKGAILDIEKCIEKSL